MKQTQVKDMHIYDYLRILYKWRKVAIVLFAIIVLTVTAFTLVQTPVYRATARIHIERATPKALDIKDLMPVDASSTEFYQTQYKILQSHSQLQRFAVVVPYLFAMNASWNHFLIMPLFPAYTGQVLIFLALSVCRALSRPPF